MYGYDGGLVERISCPNFPCPHSRGSLTSEIEPRLRPALPEGRLKLIAPVSSVYSIPSGAFFIAAPVRGEKDFVLSTLSPYSPLSLRFSEAPNQLPYVPKKPAPHHLLCPVFPPAEDIP